MGNQHHPGNIGLRHGREVLDWVVAGVWINVRADHMAVIGEQQRRPIRLRSGHGKGADGSARAGPVIDDDPLLEPLSDRLGDHAGACVKAAAGGDRNEDANFIGQALGPYPSRCKDQHTSCAPFRQSHGVSHRVLLTSRKPSLVHCKIV